MLRWPLREALLAYLERLRAEALTGWRFQRLEWAVLAAAHGSKVKPPPLPEILRSTDGDP